jgi:hypothetical protein
MRAGLGSAEQLLLSCRHYVSTCQKKGGKACPAAWALETTDDFRRYSSVLDILPSAVQAQSREDTVMFINRDIFGMFRAMSAHKSQSRWCAALAHAR